MIIPSIRAQARSVCSLRYRRTLIMPFVTLGTNGVLGTVAKAVVVIHSAIVAAVIVILVMATRGASSYYS